MTLIEARRVRDLVRKAGIHCVVPLGYGPSYYFARIWTVAGSVEFYCERDWVRYRVGSLRKRIIYLRSLNKPRRSPLDMMIDKACGIE